MILGTDHYFLTGGGGGGGGGVAKVCEKFFAEAVNTELNCMQVKKSVFRKTKTPQNPSVSLA